MKKNIKKLTLAYLASLLVLGGSAWARQPEIKHEDIMVAKGQTLNGDIATDKSITVEGLLNGSATAIGGGTVTVSGQLTGDLVSMGGPVYIPGKVDGDVSSIGGPVDVSGKVSGNVSAVGGKVTLSGEGRVDGEISALGGGVEKGPKAVHNGSINSFSSQALKGTLSKTLSMARNAARMHPGPGDSRNWRTETRVWSTDFSKIQASDFKTLSLFIAAWAAVVGIMLAAGVLLVTLPAVFFPDNVQKVHAAINGDVWRACAIGALILVGLFPGLLLMIVSILGIPLAPFALILFAAAAVLGLSAFSIIVQGRFFEGIKKTGPAGLPGKAAAGAALVAALLFTGKIVPLVGGLLVLVAMMLLAFGIMTGLGAAWMTRMGTRPFTPAAPPAAPVPPVTPAQ
jgi:cytoskeletal protein CcmA (bactofilin family)